MPKHNILNNNRLRFKTYLEPQKDNQKNTTNSDPPQHDNFGRTATHHITQGSFNVAHHTMSMTHYTTIALTVQPRKLQCERKK